MDDEDLGQKESAEMVLGEVIAIKSGDRLTVEMEVGKRKCAKMGEQV